MKKEKRSKTEMICVRNAYYADVLDHDGKPMTDDEGNKLKVLKAPLYAEKTIDYTVYTIEHNGEVHEFLDEASAKAFKKDCK